MWLGTGGGGATVKGVLAAANPCVAVLSFLGPPCDAVALSCTYNWTASPVILSVLVVALCVEDSVPIL